MRLWAWVLLGILIVVGLAFLVWSRNEYLLEEEASPERPSLIDDVSANRPAPENDKNRAISNKLEKPADWKYLSKRERRAWMRENRPIDTNTVISTAPVISSFRRKKNGRKPNFENYVQSELAHYVVPGRDMPPPDYISDEQALEAIETPVIYLEDDSAEVREEKQAVEDMLSELRKYMEAGGHADEYFQKLYARQELEGEAVQTVRREVRALLEEGKIDDAQETLIAFNEYLKSKGIPPVDIKLSQKFYEE